MAKKTSLYVIFNSISENKKNLIETGVIEESDYSPYMMNRMLAHYLDTLPYAQMMNKKPSMSPKDHYEFLLNAIPKKKRYRKHYYIKKKKKDMDIEILREYYKCTLSKAKEICSILTEKEIDMLRKRLYKGETVMVKRKKNGR